MRPVLVGLLAAATAVSASECVGNTIDDIVAIIPCGDEFVSKCLHKHVDVLRLEEIEPCFIAAGCSKEDAVWFTQECNVPDSALDLKKRATSEESTTAKTTAKTSSTSAKKTSTTAPSSTEATTTSSSTSASSTTSSTLATSTSSTTSSTSSDSGTSNAARATTNSGTTTGTLACSVTSTKDTSFCSMTGDSTLGCVATTTLIASCAPGNLCTTDAAGANVCMKRDDHLTTSGLIVTIALAIALAATIISLVALACIQRNKAKKDKMEAAAKLGGKIRPMDDMEAKPYKIGGGGESSEVDLPLITPGGKRSPQAGTGAQQGYFEQGGSGSNSVSPGHVPQIQLHQGLGALGQDTPPGQHWSNEYAARSR